MRMAGILATLVLLVSVAVTDAQQPNVSLGPRVGERLPDFAAPDQRGVTRTLESVLGPHGAMVVFYRSADW